MTVTDETVGTRPRRGPASTATPTEVGILLYRGCQSAMVHGLTDMLVTASDFSAARGGRELRLSHWSSDEAGRFDRSFDTHPGADGSAAFLVAPGRLSDYTIVRPSPCQMNRRTIEERARTSAISSRATRKALASSSLLASTE